MKTAQRYEIIDKIASGDFATVYRARDHELGREVAVKQIHKQFLGDRQQLDRYWHEARLMASLQHPNILTIYDIVRPRGWLILELMRGSLKQNGSTPPIDLDFLRVATVGCLNALQLLHANGIVHGDVKPGNMLADKQNRIKLGDFGLARRAANEEGSLLKGTAKYMAPEMISDEFGPVGPAGDLYSLGFSAYELMCGSQFESLFPGLDTFGPNRQMAWLMWHTTTDRTLPQIDKVLEGVPEDLAQVIQRLIEKDQSRRYRSAAAVLDDLRHDAILLDRPAEQEDPEAEANRIKAAKKKRRLRIAAACTLACSLVLTVATLLPGKQKPAAVELPGPTQGVVRSIYQDERKLVLELSADGTPKEITVKPRDRIFINDRARLLRDLQPGDVATIKIVHDESGRRITEIFTSRPDMHKGRIAEVQADLGQFTLDIEEGDDQGEQLVVSVPETLAVKFNGMEQLGGKSVMLTDLLPGDLAIVYHVAQDTGRTVTALSVRRVVSFEGVVRDLDTKQKELTIAQGEPSNPRLVRLPLSAECEVTVNGRRIMNRRMLKYTDLRPGDRVAVAHDTRIVRVNAYRVLSYSGVVRKVHYSAKTIDVASRGKGKPITYIIGTQCTISLGGEIVELGDLRDGDTVEITHDSPDAKTPEAMTVTAARLADKNRWAILVGVQNYEDRSLSRLKYTLANTKLLSDALVRRYRVPSGQAMLLADESLVRLEQGIPAMLNRIHPDGKVVLYFAGHAYRNEQGNVYLAPQNFDLSRMNVTGLSLQWLVDEFENCQAKEKLLLLDCSNAGDGPDTIKQPSTAEMLRSLKTPPGRAPLRTVTAVASCSAGQRGVDWADKQCSLFAWCLADGFSGTADKNRDNRLEVTELFAFLDRSMPAAAAKLKRVQTPVLFLPDDRPPRLSDEAKKAIRRLAAHLRQHRIDMATIGQEYLTAAKLSDKELEPKLLYGLLLLKAKQRSDALRHLEELKIEHPKLLFPMQGLAWIRFERRTYQTGVDELLEMISRIPKPKKPTDRYPEHHRQIFYWTGQMREFAATVAIENRHCSTATLQKLDAAVNDHGALPRQLYTKGCSATRSIRNDFNRRLSEAADHATASKLRMERRRLIHYASFPLDNTAKRILASLDR